MSLFGDMCYNIVKLKKVQMTSSDKNKGGFETFSF